jgi:AHBA synthesis associated protein
MSLVITSTPAAIILDFDETLADSSAGRHWAMQLTVAKHLGREITAQEAAGIIHRFSSLESQMDHLASSPDLAAAMVRTFREHYYGEDRIPPMFYPGMLEALVALAERGPRLAVVTSRFRYAEQDGLTWGVLPELERMGALELFSAVVGYEDTVEHKPSAEPFSKCLELLSVQPGEVIAVGDSPLDVRGARRAGLRAAVGALWGTVDRQSLLAELPDIVLAEPSELTGLAG